jgi:hypothetical protein
MFGLAVRLMVGHRVVEPNELDQLKDVVARAEFGKLLGRLAHPGAGQRRARYRVFNASISIEAFGGIQYQPQRSTCLDGLIDLPTMTSPTARGPALGSWHKRAL